MVIRVEQQRRIVSAGHGMLEAPRFFEGRIYLSDIYAGAVFAVDPAGKVELFARFPAEVSGLGFMPNGDLLAVQMVSCKLLRFSAGGGLTEHADLSAFADERINDMIVSAEGRAYVTQSGRPPEFAPTRIITVEPDGTARSGAEGLLAPNGIGIAPDGRRLVVSESRGALLTMFDIEPNGDLANRRALATLDRYQVPDGLCFDDAGGAWVGVIDFPNAPGGPVYPGFRRYGPTGELTHILPTPEGRHAVACCFGGEGRRTLYLTTSEKLLRSDAAGSGTARLEAIELEGIAGAGLP